MTKLALLLLVVSVFGTGEWTKVAKNTEKVKTLSKLATKFISDGTNSMYHKKLVEVVEAKRQLVAGLKYSLTLNIKETECRKSRSSFEEAQSCDFRDSVALQTCIVTVWKKEWLNFTKVLEFNCSNAPDVTQKVVGVNAVMDKLHRKMFQKFTEKYKKSYSTDYEREKRFRIFKVNLKKIRELNENEKGTATYGVTQFADHNEREFRRYLGFRPSLAQTDNVLSKAEIPQGAIPESFDWRTKNAVTEVKNQGQCGSCWAFSTTGNIEGQWAINKKKLLSLSEQELVDCDKVDEGCNGGLPSNAYKEIIRLGGLETETEYPYEGEDDKCSFKKKEVKVYINSSVAISQNETEIAAWLVKNGPISIGINANAMQFYFGGISHPWKFLCSPDNLDHGVLIVGYGVHTYPLFKSTIPFWIIKNSWGASWGEQGYYRVYRGDGTCGLNRMATSSTIN